MASCSCTPGGSAFEWPEVTSATTGTLRPLPRPSTARTDIGEQDGELVAAESRGAAEAFDLGEQHLADALQQRVADRVAEQVDHFLEAIEIEPEHGKTLAMATGVGDLVLELLAPWCGGRG